MAESARPYIAALRAGHDRLVTEVEDLGPDDLFAQSGAAEWPVHGVLSHLGSGAEIARLTLLSQLAPSGTEVAAPDVEANGELVALYESLSDEQLRDARIDLGYLPEPIDIATLASMRLSEQTLHGWDVIVAHEPDAPLMPEAVPHLIERSGALLGWIGKAGQVDERPVAILVRTSDPERRFGLYIADAVSLGEAPDDPTGTLDLPAESWLRLVAGRLGAARTPSAVSVSGPVSLDDLRRVFPGY
jgi:uncharacterized protein (TIGR03083 family)